MSTSNCILKKVTLKNKDENIRGTK